MHLAMIGTRGVPARYGGFETAVEELGRRLADRGHRVSVYCRNENQTERSHLGMELINLPAVRRRQLETLSHTALSVLHAVTRSRPDAAFVFNAANAPLIEPLRWARIPFATHVDGLEWQRAKWEGAGARYFEWAVGRAVRRSDAVISDARAIAAYVKDTYGVESVFLPYGAPVVAAEPCVVESEGLVPRGYHLVVARMEPENHVVEIVRGYVASDAEHPLVVVGSAPYADTYLAMVHAAAVGDARVRFMGAVWDQKLLDQLYANCLSYLHGHSVGGTNPSLLRAMGAAAPVTAYDVIFNREVTDEGAKFFDSQQAVTMAVEADEQDPAAAARRGAAGRGHVQSAYRWDEVADGYERLAAHLLSRRRPAWVHRTRSGPS